MLCQSKTHQPRARNWDTHMSPRQGNRKLTKAPSSLSFPRVNPSALSLSSLFTRYTVLGSRTTIGIRRSRSADGPLSLSLDEPSPKDNGLFVVSGRTPAKSTIPYPRALQASSRRAAGEPPPGHSAGHAQAQVQVRSGQGKARRNENEKHESRITGVGDRKARNQVARSLDVSLAVPPHAQDWDRRLREAIMKPAGRIGILLLHSEGGVGASFFSRCLQNTEMIDPGAGENSAKGGFGLTFTRDISVAELL
jgi:hypothetical protein